MTHTVCNPSGVQVWAKPMAVAGRRAVAILNRTDTSAQVKIDSSKLGLVGTPRLLRDVWNGRDLAVADVAFSVPAHDLVLLAVEGEDKKPAEYLANESNIGGIQATTGICNPSVTLSSLVVSAWPCRGYRLDHMPTGFLFHGGRRDPSLTE